MRAKTTTSEKPVRAGSASRKADSRTYSLESVMALQKAAELGIEPGNSEPSHEELNVDSSLGNRKLRPRIPDFRRLFKNVLGRFAQRLLTYCRNEQESKGSSA